MAKVEEVVKGSEKWIVGTQLLRQRHGDIMLELIEFQDFSLFHLIPHQGLFVKGFGQAFEVKPNKQIDVVHLDQGHIK